ncbi:arrestin domain-containing protein 17-like [Dysidea avara]|uniref:arrestin domain-containing protein 17-like n=1 Tax=Dysidea avara TaxID=196820 RepID=UPI00331C36DB
MGRILLYIDLFEKQAFCAGSTINGKVVLQLEKAKMVDKINVTFSGRAYIFVSEFEQELKKEKCSHIDSDQENLVDFTTTVWSGSNQQFLDAGRHTFPFSIEIPHSLPSSFLCENLKGCHIAYGLKATVVRPKKKDQSTEIPVSVSNIVDVGHSSFVNPQCVSSTKEKCSLFKCFSNNGHIAMAITTNHCGYCVGDSVIISADIENHTNSKVSSLQTTLMRNVMHKDHVHKKYCTILETAEDNKIWTKKMLQIPSTSPSITDCHLVKVTYELKVKLRMTNKSKLTVSLPITIGSAKEESSDDGYSEQCNLVTRYPSNDTLLSVSSTECLLD